MELPMLLVERRGAVLHVTINRPEKRNALALATLDALGDAFTGHAGDEGIACAVLTGAGDRSFAAGGDLRELDALRTADEARAMSARGRLALAAIRGFPAPVVAVLNGHALGGGAELAMACDLRIAAPHAELGFLQAELNVTSAWGGGIDLLAALGPARALELLASARRLPARAALELGLLQKVAAPNEDFTTFVADYVAALTRRPARVLRAQKALTGAFRQRLHAELAAVEEAGFVPAWIHADHWEAAAAALVKPARRS
jgi:enoyl-CoA hydratase